MCGSFLVGRAASVSARRRRWSSGRYPSSGRSVPVRRRGRRDPEPGEESFVALADLPAGPRRVLGVGHVHGRADAEGRRAGGPGARRAGARAPPRPTASRRYSMILSGGTVARARRGSPTRGPPARRSGRSAGRRDWWRRHRGRSRCWPGRGPGAGGRSAERRQSSGGHLGGHLLVHRPEQVLLVAEVVVERAPGQAGPLDDLLGAGGLEPVPGEHRRAVSSRARRVSCDMGGSQRPVPRARHRGAWRGGV